MSAATAANNAGKIAPSSAMVGGESRFTAGKSRTSVTTVPVAMAASEPDHVRPTEDLVKLIEPQATIAQWIIYAISVAWRK
jgi:hypothetical protein